MHRIKGYSLVELLVTLFIAALLLGAAYYTYTELFRDMKEESESVELQMEKVIGLELLRLDMEHVGYGIAHDADDKILELKTSPNELVIRSTLNNTNQSTMGWVLCVDGDMETDKREDTDNNNIVYINAVSGEYNSVVDDASCPSAGTYIGFPIASNANACEVDGTYTCNTITYRLAESSPPPHCSRGTRNLLRVVNNGTGDPVLSCVADFKITFDLDTDNDGVVDCNTGSGSCSLPDDNEEIRKQVKRINVYILMQEGGLNKNYSYPGGNPVIDGIELELPSDYLHYRWKVIKISAKPRGMLGGIILK